MIHMIPYDGEQGEWEGNILDLVLGALRAFPSAAFLGSFYLYAYLNVLLYVLGKYTL